GLKRLEGEAFTGLRTPAVGRIDDFPVESVLDTQDVRRLPRTVPLALAAAREAIEQAGLNVSNLEQSRRSGLVLGTGGGGLSFVEAQYRSWFTEGKGSLFAIT